MKNVRKILAAASAAVIMINTVPLTAFADSIYDTAEDIVEGETYSVVLLRTNSSSYAEDDEKMNYRIDSPTNGTLCITIDSYCDDTRLNLYDYKGEYVPIVSYESVIGSSETNEEGTQFRGFWNSVVEKYSGSVSFQVSEGTYFISIYQNRDSPAGEMTFSVNIHSWKTDWSYDNNEHWIECSICGARRKEDIHQYSDGDKTYANCLICGARDPRILLGDIDRSGTVNAIDAAAILKSVLYPSYSVTVETADMNGDGRVNAVDALYILQMVLGKVPAPSNSASSNSAQEDTETPETQEPGSLFADPGDK